MSVLQFSYSFKDDSEIELLTGKCNDYFIMVMFIFTFIVHHLNAISPSQYSFLKWISLLPEEDQITKSTSLTLKEP